MTSGRQLSPYRRGAEAERQRRSAILEAATEHFSEKGFVGTTTEEIALSAGITKRTLYRYMGTKTGILYGIHQRFFLASGILDGTFDHSGSTATERLSAFIKRHVQIVVDHRDEISVFFDEFKHLDSAQKASILRQRRDYENLAQSIMLQGVESGEFDLYDPGLAARCLLGAMNEMSRWLEPDGQLGGEDIAQVIATIFIDGLALGSHPPLETLPKVAIPQPNHMSIMDNIVHESTRLFNEKGYPATRTREIARATNLSSGSLYYHAKSKEFILSEIHHRMMRDGLDLVGRAAQSGQSWPNTMHAMVYAHLNVAQRHRNPMTIFLESKRYLSPDALAQAVTERDAYVKLFETVIQNASRDGTFRDFDSRVISLIIIGSLNSTYRWFREDGKLSTNRFSNVFAQLILFGLRGTSSSRHSRRTQLLTGSD
ncbi:TetR family transcriptional regulator [Ornithinimicrobium faecis]|uniref:TetR family transcriptional regulator n=1 Tax=Ornithinimicrobium faecis TaxID=2934158 RepID=UPI002117A98A|nr:TetR family transcriptional regulator [Ornithinimicrobium sp. HY1745]